MPRALLGITLAIVALARVASAEPCAETAATLRRELDGEARRMGYWVLAWRIFHSAAAVGQFAIAASGKASDNDTKSLWVGGAKSSLAALGFWFSPLRIHVPPPTGDACTDLALLRNTVERVASDERATFWAGHVSGVVVNGIGGVILAETASWQTGLTSFASGLAVGLINTYTMPRASWRQVGESSWTAGVTTGHGRWQLVVAGRF